MFYWIIWTYCIFIIYDFATVMVVIVGVGTSNGITEGVVKIGVVLVFVFIVAVGIVGLFISLSIINCFGSSINYNTNVIIMFINIYIYIYICM